MANKILLPELKNTLKSTYDLFICCASFENRSTAVPTHISTCAIKDVVVIANEEFNEDIEENTAIIMTAFGERASCVSTSTHNPLYTSDKIYSALIKILVKSSNISVLVDITTFTRESLLILMRIFKELNIQNSSIDYIYLPAKNMSQDWLTENVKECRTVLGFSGEFSPTKKLHLILLQGFEIERAKALIDHYEPSSISIGIGSKNESITDEFYNRNEKFFNELKHQMFDDLPKFEISPSDAQKTAQAIEEQLKLYSGYNIVLAPLNTKISTIGAGFAAIKNPKIQVCYAEMELYNIKEFSEPADYSILFKMPEY